MTYTELVVCGECGRRMDWLIEHTPWGEARTVFCLNCDDAADMGEHLYQLHMSGIPQELFHMNLGSAPRKCYWEPDDGSENSPLPGVTWAE